MKEIIWNLLCLGFFRKMSNYVDDSAGYSSPSPILVITEASNGDMVAEYTIPSLVCYMGRFNPSGTVLDVTSY